MSRRRPAIVGVWRGEISKRRGVGGTGGDDHFARRYRRRRKSMSISISATAGVAVNTTISCDYRLDEPRGNEGMAAKRRHHVGLSNVDGGNGGERIGMVRQAASSGEKSLIAVSRVGRAVWREENDVSVKKPKKRAASRRDIMPMSKHVIKMKQACRYNVSSGQGAR